MISRDELISRLDPWMNRPLFRDQSYRALSRQDALQCANLGTYWA
jgi:hypothetical protein